MRWFAPPPRFPHHPDVNSSGPGWYLPKRAFDAHPRDYEGPHGSGLLFPMVKEPTRASHVRTVLRGFFFVAMGIALPVVVAVSNADGRWTPAELEDVGVVLIFAVVGMVGGVYGLIIIWSGLGDLRDGRSTLPKVMLTVDGIVQSRQGKVAQVPWDALGPAQFGWTKGIELPSLLDEPDPTRAYRGLENWLWFELDAVAMERHLGHGDGATELRIRVDDLDCDPRIVVLLVEFYRDHPEERAELRTVEWEDRAAALAQTLDPLVIVVGHAARAKRAKAGTAWKPPPARFPHDPKNNDFGPGWFLRHDHATGPPRRYDGRWGTGFAVPLVPTSEDEPAGSGRAVYLGLWAAILGVFAMLTLGQIIHDGIATVSVLQWLLVASFPVLVGGVVVDVRRSGMQRRRDERAEPPSVTVTEEGLVLINARHRLLQIPWDAVGTPRLFWDRGGVGPSDLRQAAAPGEPSSTSLPIGPYGEQPYPGLLNWLSWQLDAEAMLRHRGDPWGRIEDELVVVVDRFYCDPRIVVRLIEYYRDHPEERAELNSVLWQDRADQLAQTVDAST